MAVIFTLDCLAENRSRAQEEWIVNSTLGLDKLSDSECIDKKIVGEKRKAYIDKMTTDVDTLLVKLCKDEAELLKGIGTVIERVSMSLECENDIGVMDPTINESIESVKKQLSVLEETTKELSVKKAAIHYFKLLTNNR